MGLREVFELIIEKLDENWVKILTAAIFTLFGWFIGHRRARRNWRRREFFDRLNVSLNVIHEGTLQIRTLLEKRCEQIFLNSAAARVVIDAAQRTVPENPLLPLPAGDYWFYLNSILNEVAEKFASGTVRRELGLEVRCELFVFCLTCEAAGLLRQKKIRAMVIRKSLLQNLPEEPPRFESPHHETRWQTLNTLARLYETSPERFLTIEICQ